MVAAGTAGARENMTLNGQMLVVAFVAAKGSIFPDKDVDAPSFSAVTAKVTAL